MVQLSCNVNHHIILHAARICTERLPLSIIISAFIVDADHNIIIIDWY
jgi:hypothetical protein